MDIRPYLLAALTEMNLQISDKAYERFNKYAQLLADYNEKVNLTAITDERGIAEKHFADSLSLLDEVILVDIYPAREAPIPGITSKLIYDNLRPGIEKSMCKKEDILNILKDKNIEVLITLGAGDIDNYVPEIKKILERKND